MRKQRRLRRQLSCESRESSMVRSAVIFALLCAILYSSYVPCIAFTFDDCGSTLGKFSNVSVSGCSTADEKCPLVRGTNSSIYIVFTPNESISQVNLRVYGVMFDVPVPFPMAKPNVCKDPDSGVQCPLVKNQEYHYKTSMVVQKKFPSVSVNIKWEFVDASGKKIICILFPAKVK